MATSQTSRSRALVVCSYLPLPERTGGAKRTARLIEAMERAGARPHLLTLEATSEGLAAAAARGWEVEVHPRPGTSAAGRLVQYARRELEPPSEAIAARIRDLGRTAAFVQLEEIPTGQLVEAVPPGVATVVSLHNVDSAVIAALARTQSRGSKERLRHRWRSHRMAVVERRAVSRAGTLLCVSREDLEHFEALGARNALLVPNGVDAELFEIAPEPPASLRVLFFGTFGYPPNVDGTIRFVREGWPAVRASAPNATLRIAGSGPIDRVRAAAAGVAGVEVLGFVESLVGELTLARAVIVPIWVGGGTRIKVLEALAAARPVVGTPLGVERIGFENEIHGLTADEPEGLARALTRVLADDDLATRLAARGRELVRPYGWALATAPAEALYRGWLARAR